MSSKRKAGGQRRLSRSQQKAQRQSRPRTLRTRLVVSAVSLIAVVCAVMGTVTTIALEQHLYKQLGSQVTEAAKRVGGPPDGPGGVNGSPPEGAPDSSGSSSSSSSTDSSSSSANSTTSGAGAGTQTVEQRLSDFMEKGGTQEYTVAAAVDTNGGVTQAYVARMQSSTGTTDSGVTGMDAVQLNETQMAELAAVSRDGSLHTATLTGLGEYRVTYVTGERGTYYVALPTESVTTTISTLILVEVSVTAAGLVAAGIAGSVLVGVALRPLRKVASTATRVSELPLHTGEVTLNERVAESETDPHTEVGQVGAALNRMLDHVHGALHSRQQSEMRVRQFVADASHELRTPLASIRGYAELTRRGREETGPDTRHALGRIESEAGRMTLLVEDLLLLARLDAGRPLQFDQTDLVPLVVDTISDARAAGRDHNWRLDLPDEPALVSADAARLQQVLVNLLANARTHTPPGTTVTARVQRRGPWLCVDVQDDGQGIPADLLPHVFERFARGDSARSRSTGSTGLGLAIVQAVATAHGGAVTVDSVPGQTIFTVHLPALAPETDWQSDSQVQHSATTWVEQGA
ncbi:HAMP domain-containing sensor histidine kinase [Streptomyces sp. ADMS]|uniref:HAMP domain-containing sensor histidine kinase n=1 Tax=Streptomyces sp. ADMS TaxID=3071415 RepID=UPI00296FAB2E|nr:HAMP domain-containing sensor histidine kinase [Streptomyces sp. ADMS]MDW4907465.1 HAMP domain-containing sensor histidine kinase [Streptomyces sp. ADMS]